MWVAARRYWSTGAAQLRVVAALPAMIGWHFLSQTMTSVPIPVCAAGGTTAGAYGSSQAVKDLLGGLFHYVAGERPARRQGV